MPPLKIPNFGVEGVGRHEGPVGVIGGDGDGVAPGRALRDGDHGADFLHEQFVAGGDDCPKSGSNMPRHP